MYSYIEMTRFANALGNTERIEYRWEGDSPITRIGWRELAYTDHEIYRDKDGRVSSIRYGTFRLKPINSEPLDGYWDCVRLDYPFWFLYVWWNIHNKILDLFYRRLIVTCAVWGLADFSQGAIP